MFNQILYGIARSQEEKQRQLQRQSMGLSVLGGQQMGGLDQLSAQSQRDYNLIMSQRAEARSITSVESYNMSIKAAHEKKTWKQKLQSEIDDWLKDIKF